MIDPPRNTSNVYSSGGVSDESGTVYCRFLWRTGVEKFAGGSSGWTRGACGWLEEAVVVVVAAGMAVSSDGDSSMGIDGTLKLSAIAGIETVIFPFRFALE